MTLRIHRIWLTFLVTLSLLAVADNALALGGKALQRAKAAMDAKDYAKAISLLKRATQEDSKDGEAQFTLANCYVKTGNYKMADQVFARAMRLNPLYGKRIGRSYMDAGTETLRSGRIRQCRILFNMAVKHEPALAAGIAKEAFQQGNDYFNKGLYDLADGRYSVANAFDGTYGEKISDLYYQIGKSVGRGRSLEFYRLASWYSSKHNEEIGLKLLDSAKRYTEEQWINLYKSEAAKYVSEETVRAVFPAPSWKTVQAFMYTGKGYDEKNSPEYHIRTVRFGKEVQLGDRLVVEADGDFRIWNAGWEACASKCEIIPEKRIDGEYFYVQGPEEKRITVKVQRYH